MSKTQRVVWWLLWPTGAAYLVYIASIAPRDTENPSQFLQFATAAAFIVTGLIAWRRRPANRLGLLMMLTGYVYLEQNLGLVQVPTAWAFFEAFNRFETVVIPHLLLAYPTGRLEDRLSRRLIGLDYAAVAALSVIYLFTNNPRRYSGCPCLSNALGFIDAEGVYEFANTLKDVVPALFAFVVIGVLVTRLVKSTPPQRRALAPLWFAAAVTAAVFIWWVLFYSVIPHTIAARRVADNAINVVVMTVPIAFLVGILRMRFARAAVSDLVIELGDSPPPGRLRDALARSLGDPSLQLAFPLPDGEGYVDVEGRSVALPAEGSGRAVTFVEREGVPLAALVHDPVLTDARELVTSVTAAARLALENERLQAEVRAQLEEVRESRARIVEASDEARRRIERDLHDGAQQRLLTLALSLRMAKDRLEQTEDSTARKVLEEAEDEMRTAIAELRELAQGIHPAVLTEQGLSAAIEMLAEKTPLPVHLDVTSERFPSPVEATAYFVVSEALSNIVKYSGAARASIAVRREDDLLVIEVSDDGVGGADVGGGTGLRGLADRVAALDGRLSITSERGRGTAVRAEISCR